MRSGSPDDSVRHVGRDVEGELEALFVGAQRQRLHRIADAVVEIERDRLEPQLARFDLGEVENVVDDAEQRVGGRFDHPEVLALLDGELGVERQIRHADDAVHRRPNLVAHVGEKLRFQPHRFERRVPRFFELGRNPFALRDVAVDAEDRLPAAVVDQRRADQKRDRRAIRPKLHRLERGNRSLGEQLGPLRLAVLDVLRQRLEAPADERLARKAIRLARLVVDVDHDLAVGLEDDDRVVGEHEEVPVLRGLPGRGLGALARGDVARDAQQAGNLSVLVAVHLLGDQVLMGHAAERGDIFEDLRLCRSAAPHGRPRCTCAPSPPRTDRRRTCRRTRRATCRESRR